MKCPSCGKLMQKLPGPGETWKCSCESYVGIDRAAPFDKPVDAQRQVRNITDEVDPDLHRKPER